MGRHQDLLRAVRQGIQLTFSKQFPGLRIRTMAQDTGIGLRSCPCCHVQLPKRQQGTIGSCDLRGYIGELPWPMPFEIEIKVGRDTLRDSQRDYAEMCDLLGVPHYVAHSQTESLEDIESTAEETAHWLVRTYRQLRGL